RVLESAAAEVVEVQEARVAFDEMLDVLGEAVVLALKLVDDVVDVLVKAEREVGLRAEDVDLRVEDEGQRGALVRDELSERSVVLLLPEGVPGLLEEDIGPHERGLGNLVVDAVGFVEAAHLVKRARL